MSGRRRTLLAAARRDKLRSDLTDKHIIKLKVGMRDHDLLGHMTNSRYNELGALAREDFMIRTGIEDERLAHGATLVTNFEDITFLRMLRSGMDVELITQLIGWSQEYLLFTHAFLARDHIRAEANCIASFQEASGKKTSAAALAGAIGHSGVSPPIPDKFNRALTLLAKARPAG